MGEGLSLREFGRQLDVTAEAVRKAIADGKIPADCVGQRKVGKGTTVWPTIIDPDRAAKHWGHNRNQNQVRDKSILAAGAKRGWAQRRGEEPPPEEDADDADDVAPASNGSGGKKPNITDYNTITAAYKAKMAKVEYEERIGRLVPADLIEAKFVGLMTALRNRVLGVPSEAKGKIPHLTIDEIEILEDLIVGALEEVADEDDDDVDG